MIGCVQLSCIKDLRMRATHILIAICLSILGTTIMTYITMATPIGPWIAPTLTLLLLALYKISATHIDEKVVAYQIGLASIGGILATGVGFYMPTLFFADAVRFQGLLHTPWYAILLVAIISGVAGWFGLWCARVLYTTMVLSDAYPFPISQLMYGLISAHAQVGRLYEMGTGFCGTVVFCAAQTGVGPVPQLIPATVTLMPALRIGFLTIPAIPFDLWPMVWAIGFITGHMLLMPLLVGVVSQIILLGPVHTQLFASLSIKDLSLAFCSGMVLASTLYGMYGSITRLLRSRKNTTSGLGQLMPLIWQNHMLLYEGLAVFSATMLLGVYIGMPLGAIVHTLLFGALCTYQMIGVGARTGLAPLGRFATFVMVPAMIFFTADVWHLTVISLFVACAGGAAVDMLFSHVYVHKLQGSARMLWRYQYVGLIVGALVCGLAFFFFVTHFPLGSSTLFAHKAQTRALLFSYASVDFYALFAGLIFGAILTWLRCDPLFVLGGILMPLNLSVGLITGGLLSMCVKSRERYEPFWSGVFAANSLWMMLKVLW